MSTTPRTAIRLALDWTPNTLHTGLYIAKQRGIYASAGLEVELLPPDQTYSSTPAKRLAAGNVDLAIVPSESCLAYSPAGTVQAVYAICQEDASAIASTTLSSMRELGEGKVYGSYNAKFEDAIVRSMIISAGGDGRGMKVESQQGKFSLFDLVKKGELDATWIFLPWEGVEAELEDHHLNVFRVGDAGIPYGYSPVIAHNAVDGKLSEYVLGKFVRATREGYEIARRDVGAAVEVMRGVLGGERAQEFVRRSQESVNGFYGDDESLLGTMDKERWRKWVEWLGGQGMLKAENVDVGKLFTDAYNV